MHKLKGMNKYKSLFILRFAKLMQENVTVWKEVQRICRKKLYTADLKWYFFAFCFGFLPGKNERHYSLKAHIIEAIICAIISIFIAVSIRNKEYQNIVKKTFFQKLIGVFGDEIFYCNSDDSFLLSIVDENDDLTPEMKKELKDAGIFKNKQIPKIIEYKLFNESGLFDKPINDRDDDDSFYGSFNDVEFIINETSLKYKVASKSRTNYYEKFKGLAMLFKMNKNINARVLVRSKKKNWLFIPINKLFKNKVPDGYEKIEFESAEFNKKYDVYAYKTPDHSGQIEARYLFNTAFLERFMQIQTSFRVDRMDCSVKDNNLLIMLNTNRDLFEMNHLLGRVDDVNQYKNLFDEFSSVLAFIDVLNLSSRTKL